MVNLSSSQKLLHVARAVLLSPLSMLIWGGALGLSFQLNWSVLPFMAAGAAYSALLAVRLRDEEYLRSLFTKLHERETSLTDSQVEEMLDKMDFESRQRIRYILQLQKEIVREARAEDVQGYAKQDLDRIATQLPALIQRAVKIATRKQQLAKYLQNIDERALRSYCASLKQRIEATEDPVAKEQYEQALRAREAEIETYQAIQKASERIDSQLENVEATFASWKAKVIRIKTVDVSSFAAVSEGLYQELESLTSDIDLLDTSVSEALSSEKEQPLRATE